MTPVRAPLADAALTRLTDLEPELLDPARCFPRSAMSRRPAGRPASTA